MKQHFSNILRKLATVLTLASTVVLLGSAHSQEGTSDPSSVSDNAPLASSQTLDNEAPPVRQVDDDHPVVQAIQNSSPETPLQQLKAAQALQDLGRVDLAQNYIDQAIAAAPDAPTLFTLQQELGTAYFLRLFRSKQFTPETNQFAREVLAAAYAESRRPERLDSLVQSLLSDSPASRTSALGELERVGPDAATPLLRILADGSASDQHGIVARALYDLGPAVEGPLVAALDAPHDKIRLVALEVLGRRKVEEALPHLVYASVSDDVSDREKRIASELLNQQFASPPSKDEAIEFLSQEYQRYQQGDLPALPNPNQSVTMWIWDQDQDSPRLIELNPNLASVVIAKRFAQRLYSLDPSQPQSQIAYLTALIEAERRTNGMDLPLQGTQVAEVAESLGVVRLEEVLQNGITEQRPIAAAGAAELLGKLGTSDLVVSSDGRPRPLVEALRHGDRRLRFAATEAILALNPQVAYPGSSYLVESLLYFLGSAGQRRVLIGHPRPDQSQTLAAEFYALGYEADSAQFGRDLFKMAVAHPDYEIILISDSLLRPNANELVQQLRKDPRTSKLPIGLLARQEHLPRFRRIASENALTLAMPWPYESESVQFTAVQLRSSVGSEFVDAERRLEQALVAADGLLKLASSPDSLSFYDVITYETRLKEAFYTPELTSQVAQILGTLATSEAQRELVNYASQPLLPETLRTEAVDAFASAIEKRGVLLRSDEVLLQYDRYNDSANLGKETQLILARILDLIEAANRRPLGAPIKIGRRN